MILTSKFPIGTNILDNYVWETEIVLILSPTEENLKSHYTSYPVH